MKKKQHAKDRREALWKERKPEKDCPENVQRTVSRPAVPFLPTRISPEEQARIDAEETKLFLHYLENAKVVKEEEEPVVRSKRSSSFIPAMNLESGMPVVDEAVSRMRLGIQQMRSCGVRVVKLIHGYGSTGTGGRIRVGVRAELDGMKRKKMIRDYISGEHFGPFDESSRKLVELNKNVAADPDYGRGNQGITIVWI